MRLLALRGLVVFEVLNRVDGALFLDLRPARFEQ